MGVPALHKWLSIRHVATMDMVAIYLTCCPEGHVALVDMASPGAVEESVRGTTRIGYNIPIWNIPHPLLFTLTPTWVGCQDD